MKLPADLVECDGEVLPQRTLRTLREPFMVGSALSAFSAVNMDALSVR